MGLRGGLFVYALRWHTRLYSPGDARFGKLHGRGRCVVAGGCGLLSTNRSSSIFHFRGLEALSRGSKGLSEPCAGHIDGVLYRFHPGGYAPAPRNEVEHTANSRPGVASHARNAQDFDGFVSFESPNLFQDNGLEMELNLTCYRSLLNKSLPTLSMVNRSTATSRAPTPNTQIHTTRTCITCNQSNPADSLGVEARDERITRHDAVRVDQEQQRIKEEAEERERQRLAAESINRKAPDGQNKRQRELAFFWKKKEEEELKRQEELRRRQEIVKREEEAEELERQALYRQAELERERKQKELDQARVQQELLQQHQQQQQQEREKRAREEPEDATEQEQEPDAERIKRVKKELKTTCMVCGEKFNHRRALTWHMNKFRHRMPKKHWGSGGGVTKITDLDALQVLM